MWLIIIVFLQLLAKEGFPVIRVICHQSVVYVTGSQKHFPLPSLPSALFYPREWRVCPPFPPVSFILP